MRVILIGGGRGTFFLAQTFRRHEHAVTVVAHDAGEAARYAALRGVTVVHGDGTSPALLADAGARGADLLLAATSRDADNLVACQIARTAFAVPRVVAVVDDPDNEEVFRALGIQAISISQTIAHLVEQWATCDRVKNLLSAAEGRVTLSEVTLDADPPLGGQPIAAAGLPEGSLIACVLRDDETLVPRGSTVLRRGDRVLLVALAERHARALHLLTRNTQGSHA